MERSKNTNPEVRAAGVMALGYLAASYTTDQSKEAAVTIRSFFQDSEPLVKRNAAEGYEVLVHHHSLFEEEATIGAKELRKLFSDSEATPDSKDQTYASERFNVRAAAISAYFWILQTYKLSLEERTQAFQDALWCFDNSQNQMTLTNAATILRVLSHSKDFPVDLQSEMQRVEQWAKINLDVIK